MSVLVVAALAALTLSGCGLSLATPSPRPPTATTTTTGGEGHRTPDATSAAPSAAAIARTRHTHELPTPSGRLRVLGGWRTPMSAVRAFAGSYINWTAATVVTHLRALASVSLGQARSSVLDQAREVAGDTELRRGGVGNSGAVEAVAPVAGSRDRYAVVTRERTSATDDSAYRGLGAAWHVALATVTRLPDRLWVLSGWQPED